MADEIARGPFAADMGDDGVGDRHALSVAAHQRAERVIVGQLVGHRFEPADRGERLAAQRDRRAEAGSRKAELQSDQHIGQELIVDRRGAKPRPSAGGSSAAVEACHDADARLRQSGDDVLEIIGPDHDVAVGDDQHILSGLPHHVDQIRDFAVLAVPPRIDHQCQIAARKIGDKLVDDADRRVGRIVDAKHDLHRAWIALRAKTGQIGIEIGLQSVQRLEQRDGGEIRGGRRRQPDEAARGPGGKKRIGTAERGRHIADDRRPSGDSGKKRVHADLCRPCRPKPIVSTQGLYGPTAIHARLTNGKIRARLHKRRGSSLFAVEQQALAFQRLPSDKRGDAQNQVGNPLDERHGERNLGRNAEYGGCGDQRAVLNTETAGQHEGGGATALAEAFDGDGLGHVHRMAHEGQRDPDFAGPEKHRGEMDQERCGEAAMIFPNLLQPAAEIGHVIERRPVVLFAECDKPTHQRFESAKIQRQEEAAHRRQRDGQHNEGQGAEPMRTDEIEHDADPGCHKDQKADHLDKDVDEDAGDRHIGGHAELRKKPCADDVAANADERKQRIDRFAHEAQTGENVRSATAAV